MQQALTAWSWFGFGLLLLLPSAAAAQAQGEPRQPVANWYLDLDAAYQARDRAWTERLAMPFHGEDATFDVGYVPSAGAAYGGSAGRRLWSNLTVGVGITYLDASTGTRVTGSVPHPLFFRRPREIEYEVSDVRRTEVGLHAHAGWTLHVSDRIDIRVTGGPSTFAVTRDRLSRIGASEAGPPYDQVMVDDERSSVRARFPGVNAGIDLTYHVFKSLEPGAFFWTAGIGGFVRWAGRITERSEGESDEAVAVGGWQGGLGFRLRF